MELQRKIDLLDSQISIREEKVNDYDSSVARIDALQKELKELEELIINTNIESVKQELNELKEWRDEIWQSMTSSIQQSIL